MGDIDRGILNKFNRGEVAEEAFGREDVARLQNSCESMVNFQPERLGPMSYRPGGELIPVATTEFTHMVPMVTSAADPLMLILNENAGDPYVIFMKDDALLASNICTSSLLNQDFTSAMGTGWIDDDEGSAVATINTGAGLLTLLGTGTASSKVYQTTTSTDTDTKHTFKIQVVKGIILVQMGEDGPDSADLFEGFLGIGQHIIEVTPSTDMTLTFSNDKTSSSYMSSCTLESTVVAHSVFLETALDHAVSSNITELRQLRHDASANETYFCSNKTAPFKIKRWGKANSFSVEKFRPVFGPFDEINTTRITMSPNSALGGDTTILASESFFTNHPDTNIAFEKGTLLKLAVTGQTVTVNATLDDDATSGIFVFGVGDARKFKYTIVENSGSGWTVHLEKSFDEITWQLVTAFTTVQSSVVKDDGLDAAEVYYRLRLEDKGTSGDLDLTLEYDYGVIEAEGRIGTDQGSLLVWVDWYIPLTVSQTVRDWYIGSWGGKHNWPSALAFTEGRLWFAGGNKIWGSESDFYESFDRSVEGASASVQRTIGFGSSEEIFWLAPSAKLVAGNAIAEVDIKSDSFGTVLTDLNTNLKAGSNLGCADVAPIVSDQEILFVQRGGDQLIGIDFSIQSEKHEIENFNMLNPTILSPTVVKMAIVRNPETRIYLVMSDGTMRVLLRNKIEDILGWSRMTLQYHDGAALANELVQDVAVLPNTSGEDRVYVQCYTASGAGKILKLAKTTEVNTTAASRHFDSFVVFSSPGTTITLPTGVGAVFTNGRSVAVWVDGVDDGDYVITAGDITGVTSGTVVVVGFRYEATFKSGKLGDYTSGSVLTANKRIINTGLIMKDYVQGAVTVGPDTDSLTAMPGIEAGTTAGNETSYDHLPFEYDGESETDPRIHIKATGPCNIMALSYEVKQTDRRTTKGLGASNDTGK